MNRITTLPAAAHTLIDDDNGHLVLAFSEGLAIVADGKLDIVEYGP